MKDAPAEVARELVAHLRARLPETRDGATLAPADGGRFKVTFTLPGGSGAEFTFDPQGLAEEVVRTCAERHAGTMHGGTGLEVESMIRGVGAFLRLCLDAWPALVVTRESMILERMFGSAAESRQIGESAAAAFASRVLKQLGTVPPKTGRPRVLHAGDVRWAIAQLVGAGENTSQGRLARVLGRAEATLSTWRKKAGYESNEAMVEALGPKRGRGVQ